MVEKLKTVEIDNEKCIYRINGKDVAKHNSYLKIEYKDGEWAVEQVVHNFSGKNSYKLSPAKMWGL